MKIVLIPPIFGCTTEQLNSEQRTKLCVHTVDHAIDFYIPSGSEVRKSPICVFPFETSSHS